MSIESKPGRSLEAMFLSKANVKELSAYLKRNASGEMKQWCIKNDLDDYESVNMDFSETLDFANKEFITRHKHPDYERSEIGKYPKHYIGDSTEGYSVNDWRTHDAQQVQEVFRSNANFRHGNKIKSWRIGQHKHHYDRDAHEHGLKSTRELNTFQRGYNMSAIYEKNPYESSDSMLGV